MEIKEMLSQPFAREELKWRVQSCGKSKIGKTWVRFSVYIDIMVIQDRLNNIFGWDGWKSKEYVNENHSVTVELSLWSKEKGEWITRSGTSDIAEKGNKIQDDNSIKSAATSAFKRSAAAFGIGIYLKEFKEIWGTECSSDVDGAIKCENKKENLVFYATPKIPDNIFATPKIGINTAKELVAVLQELYKDQYTGIITTVKNILKISKLEEMSQKHLEMLEISNYNLDIFAKKVS